MAALNMSTVSRTLCLPLPLNIQIFKNKPKTRQLPYKEKRKDMCMTINGKGSSNWLRPTWEHFNSFLSNKLIGWIKLVIAMMAIIKCKDQRKHALRPKKYMSQ